MRILRNYVSTKVLLNVYYSLFYSFVNYSILYWGYHNDILQNIFLIQKKALRIIFQLKKTDSVRELFAQHKILTVPALYLFRLFSYFYENINLFESRSQIHSHFTRGKDKIFVTNKTTSKLKLFDEGIKLFNKLNVQDTKKDWVEFRTIILNKLQNKPIYEIDEFFQVQTNVFKFTKIR